jgi:hypothetical protein
MGYTGRVLVARTRRSFDGSPIVAGAELLHERELGDGWWWAQFDGDPDGALRALVSETGAPVVSAFVIDSDCADVQGSTPSGVHWRTYLHPSTAQSYGAPALPQSTDQVIEHAIAWSVEAGRTADPDGLREVLEARSDFAEDTLDDLLQALGVPGLQDERRN